jgi:hypothetical protein
MINVGPHYESCFRILTNKNHTCKPHDAKKFK